jgi:SAM-dependent methyltransferase
VSDGRRLRLRQTFNHAAELYDQARPGYPSDLFDELATFAGLGAGSRVLEIGCGTGQATVPLAERGYQVVAVELGADMAALARRNLACFPSVEVIVAAFEDWPLPLEPFDAVVAATAWHWVDPAVRVAKVADALRPGGTLATIGTHHIAGGDEAFFAQAEACYERWDPETPPGGARLPAAAEVREDGDELDGSGRFGTVTFRRWEWERPYSTAAYLDVLRTYSGHMAMEPEALHGLLDCIGRLAEAHGGRITKRYLSDLRLARRLAEDRPSAG